MTWVNPSIDFNSLWSVLGPSYRVLDIRCVAEKDDKRGSWRNIVMAAIVSRRETNGLPDPAVSDRKPFANLDAVKSGRLGLLSHTAKASDVPSLVKELGSGKVNLGSETVHLNSGFEREPLVESYYRESFPRNFAGESGVPSVLYSIWSDQQPSVSHSVQSDLYADARIDWSRIASSWLKSNVVGRKVNADLILPVYTYVGDSKVETKGYKAHIRTTPELASSLTLLLELRGASGDGFVSDSAKISVSRFQGKRARDGYVICRVRHRFSTSIAAGESVTIRLATPIGDPYSDYITLGAERAVAPWYPMSEILGYNPPLEFPDAIPSLVFINQPPGIVPRFRQWALLLAGKMPTILVSRESPEALDKSYPESKAFLHRYWLSRVEGETSISPTALEPLLERVTTHLRESRGRAVVIEGLDYLALHNTFESVLRMLHLIRDTAESSGGHVTVLLNPEKFEDLQVALLGSAGAIVEPTIVVGRNSRS